MAHRGENSNEDFRFNFDDSQLDRSESDRDTAPPSTIYDPAVLAVSPDLRAKVAARKARNEELPAASDANNVTENSPFHILSPGANISRQPFDMKVDGNKARVSDKIQDEIEDQENEVCCCGLLPFHPALLILNLISVFVALTSVGIASHQVQLSIKVIAGFVSLGNLVVSGVYLSACALIFLGVLSCVRGIIGCILSYSKLKAREPPRWMQILAQCLLLLLTIFFLALAVVNAIALSKANTSSLYDNLKWANVVQADPLHSCKTERRLDCAGFDIGDCRFDNSEISNSLCPGHFCIDYCKIATDAASDQGVCAPCKQGGGNGVSEFRRCKTFEKSTTEQKGCNLYLNKDLRESYQKLLAITIIGSLPVTIIILSSATQSCFA